MSSCYFEKSRRARRVNLINIREIGNFDWRSKVDAFIAARFSKNFLNCAIRDESITRLERSLKKRNRVDVSIDHQFLIVHTSRR